MSDLSITISLMGYLKACFWIGVCTIYLGLHRDFRDGADPKYGYNTTSPRWWMIVGLSAFPVVNLFILPYWSVKRFIKYSGSGWLQNYLMGKYLYEYMETGYFISHCPRCGSEPEMTTRPELAQFREDYTFRCENPDCRLTHGANEYAVAAQQWSDQFFEMHKSPWVRAMYEIVKPYVDHTCFRR